MNSSDSLFEYLDDINVKSYSDYQRLENEKKRMAYKCFGRFFYHSTDNYKTISKGSPNIAINENFSLGIKQSFLYSSSIILITENTRSYPDMSFSVAEKSIKSFFKYIDFIKSGFVQIVPQTHYHQGIDEWDDSYYDFDPQQWSSVILDDSALTQISKNLIKEEQGPTTHSLVNFNIKFPTINDINTKELLGFLKCDDAFSKYHREVRKLYTIKEQSFNSHVFYETVNEINERVIELNTKINEEKQNIKKSIFNNSSTSNWHCSVNLCS